VRLPSHAYFRARIGRTVLRKMKDRFEQKPNELYQKVFYSLRDEPKPKPDKQTGYRIPVEGAPPRAFKTLMTDAQVLECRALAEFEGKTTQELADRYGVKRDYMYKLLSYTTRSKLIPRQKPAKSSQ
jgi:hypothetical protein